MPFPLPGDVLEIEILDAGEGNRSFARLDNDMGAFIRGVHVPGDRVQARVTKVKKRHAELSFLKLLSPSPDRVKAPCRVFGRCGGCRWQEVRYDRQLELKHKTVQDALQRLGGFRQVKVEAVRPSQQTYEYRNKVELVFSRKRADPDSSRPWALGFHVQGTGHAVLDVDTCHLISPGMNQIANQVRSFAAAQGWQAYDEKKQSGLLRSLMIRQSNYTGETMVDLITSAPVPDPQGLVHCLQQGEGAPTTIVNSIATRNNRRILEDSLVLSGKGMLEEQVCGLTFGVSAGSFLQTNTPMAEALYRDVIHQAGIQSGDRVADLYCGIGTLTLILARKAAHVWGIESVHEAVRDAKNNAVRNGIINVEFNRQILGRDGAPDLPPNLDLIITDPPREGMEPGVVEAIRGAQARRLVYVSCHPAHLARDAKRLCEGGLYQLKTVLPFDLFPQTAHIETLAVFDRNPDQI